MKKAISCLLLGLLMCCAFALPSFAGSIQTYASLCEDCHRGEMVYRGTDYGAWYIVGYTPCSYGKPKYNDTIKERLVTTTYVCTYCGAGNPVVYTATDTFHEHP